jgi:hypothetical protein
MITTNINGQPLSQAFIDQIQDDSPNVIARLMLDGVEISATIVSVTVEKGACGESDFSIGNVVATKLTATLKDLATPLKGKEIEYQLGAWTGSDYEYVSICKVTVSEAKQTRYQTEITAYSSVVSDTTDTLDTSNLPSNPTIANIATAVASQINRTITFDTSIDTTQIVMATIGSISLYQVLQIIAICSGGYIINTNDNNIRVCRFDSTPTLTVNTGMMVNLPQIEEQSFFVSGVYCLVQEESEDNDGNVIPAIEYKETITQIVAEDNGTYTLVFSDGSTMRGVGADDALVNLAFESKYITNDIFNANIKGILGYEYYPATIDLTLGDPRLEGCDVLSVLELDGNYYTVPCHRLTHKYSGGFTTDVVAVNATAESDDVGTVPPITSMLQGVKKDVVKAQTVADEAQTIARNNAQYFWFLESDPDDTGVGTGAHITETPKETFMQDPSNGGGNLLARSNGIAVRDGLTELATFGADGAQIGKNGESRLLLDYHSLQMIDKEGNTYFHISDLRDSSGKASIVATFVADGTDREFYLHPVADDRNYEVSASSGGTITKYEDHIVFETAPDEGTEITVTYTTSSEDAKAYTLGTRKADTYIGVVSVAEGWSTTASGSYSHAEGYDTESSGAYSHAEGYRTTAEGRYSHAEGINTTASGQTSHAEGWRTTASNYRSHAEGYFTEASGSASHAEGNRTTAEGQNSHAEGENTTANGIGSHAEGCWTIADGNYSHAGGYHTTASADYQMVIGKYNEDDESYAFIIGNGSDTNNTSNAIAITWDGDIDISIDDTNTTTTSADYLLYHALLDMGWT